METTFIEGLAERLGAQAGATAVFGEPVEREGVTVIPVARTAWGFGGGTGEGPEGGGQGGGGGARSTAIGYIELSDGGSRYRPILDLRPFVAAAAIGLAAGLVAAFRAAR
jgi:uncharacterized spore protein YtfJ